MHLLWLKTDLLHPIDKGGKIRTYYMLRELKKLHHVTYLALDDGTGLGLRPLLLPEGFEGTPLRKSFMLAARASKPWPGAKEPGEGHDAPKSPGRRRVVAPR